MLVEVNRKQTIYTLSLLNDQNLSSDVRIVKLGMGRIKSKIKTAKGYKRSESDEGRKTHFVTSVLRWACSLMYLCLVFRVACV